jgi:hypothetical protein
VKDDSAMLEVRLEGGYRMFWTTITPKECGRLQTLSAPALCSDTDFPGFCSAGARGIWDLWPIKNPARPHPLEDADRLCRPIKITEQTQRLALVSFVHKDGRSPEYLWIELFLASEPGPDGRSPLDDWAQVVRATKDDASKEVVLRLNLRNVTPDEIACFKSQKKLVATDLALEVRPRANQDSRSD